MTTHRPDWPRRLRPGQLRPSFVEDLPEARTLAEHVEALAADLDVLDVGRGASHSEALAALVRGWVAVFPPAVPRALELHREGAA